MPVRRRVASGMKKSLDGEAGVQSQTALNPDVNRIVIPSSCLETLYQDGGVDSGKVKLHLPWSGRDLVMPADSFKALPEDQFGRDFAGSHVSLDVWRGAKTLSRGYDVNYTQEKPLALQDFSVSEMENNFTEICMRELAGDEAVKAMQIRGKFELRAAAGCEDSYDCLAKTVETGMAPVNRFAFDNSLSISNFDNELAQKEALDGLFNNRKAAFLAQIPDMKAPDAGVNRIIVPVSYLNGSPSSGNCSLSVPGMYLTMETTANDFRKLPVDEFGESFAKDHVALCIAPGVDKLSPTYRSDYDASAAPGEQEGISVKYMQDAFTEICMSEIAGRDISGRLSVNNVKSCKDSYDVMSLAVREGPERVYSAMEIDGPSDFADFGVPMPEPGSMPEPSSMPEPGPDSGIDEPAYPSSGSEPDRFDLFARELSPDAVASRGVDATDRKDSQDKKRRYNVGELRPKSASEAYPGMSGDALKGSSYRDMRDLDAAAADITGSAPDGPAPDGPAY